MEPRALIFDFDGLIIDSERVLAECYVEILAEWGVTATFEDFGHLFGSVDADAEWDALLADWCGRTAVDLDERAAAVAGSRRDELPLLPGVVELLEDADARGWPTAIATGSARELVERRLRRLEVLDRFHHVVTRAEVERGKPFPDIYLETARRIEVEPAACVVFEDSIVGCEAALAAGMRVVACPSVVNAHCAFPDGVTRVASLLDVAL